MRREEVSDRRRIIAAAPAGEQLAFGGKDADASAGREITPSRCGFDYNIYTALLFRGSKMKTIKAEDVPVIAREFLQRLDFSEGEIVFEHNGKPQVVLVSPTLLEQRRQAKASFFALVDQIRAKNPQLSSDDVLTEFQES